MKRIAPILVALLLTGCGSTRESTRPVDPDFALYSGQARRAFDRLNYEYAARLYADALRRAREMDEAWAIATAAYNLAACRAQQGRVDDAGRLLEEARLEFSRDGTVPAQVLLLEARLALRAGSPARAASALDEFEGRNPDPASARQGRLLRARLALEAGETEQAHAILASLERLEEGEIAVEELELSADLAEAVGDHPAAAAARARAAELLRRSGNYRRMALLLRQVGLSRQAAGDPVAALDCYYRSARSFHAAGCEPEALRSIGLALQVDPAAAQLHSAGLTRLVREIQEKLESSREKTRGAE